jgi:hypothetical protein
MSQSYQLNVGQMITKAYRLMGVVPEGGVPNAAQYAEGIDAINQILKGIQTEGANVFRQTQVSLAISAGAQSVETPNQVMGVENCRWLEGAGQVSQREIPMGQFTYDQYFTLPNRLQTTVQPSVWMFDKQTSETTIWVWPCPTYAGTINATVIRMANDVTSQTDDLDFPQEWDQGLKWILADELQDNHALALSAPAISARIERRATQWREKLKNFDRPTSIFFKPWGKRGQSRLWRGA